MNIRVKFSLGGHYDCGILVGGDANVGVVLCESGIFISVPWLYVVVINLEEIFPKGKE